MLSAFCKLEEDSSSSYFLGYHVELCPRIPIQTCQTDDSHHTDSHSELPLFDFQCRTNPETVRNHFTSWVLDTASQNIRCATPNNFTHEPCLRLIFLQEMEDITTISWSDSPLSSRVRIKFFVNATSFSRITNLPPQIRTAIQSCYFSGYRKKLCSRIPFQTCQADYFHHTDSHFGAPFL